jgi:Xaa-Pro aminopeptidase
MPGSKTSSTFDLLRYPPPPMTSASELGEKIAHLRRVVEREGRDTILFTSEGALRWLTGTRHQVGDIAPRADSPVRVLIRARASGTLLVFCSQKTEMPRILDQLPPLFASVPGVELDFRETLPTLPDDVLAPGGPGYDDALGAIVRPILGGARGHQMKKLEWLYGMTSAVLVETALQLRPGMTGAGIRGNVFRSLAEHDIECNMILVALPGQEKHLHPLYSSHYRAESGGWVKLVAGARYAELIASVTIMAKVGSPLSDEEEGIYSALQQGAVEYADLFRAGASEAEIYRGAGARFAEIEDTRRLKGFARSAYNHHMGGPTSPLGNRDFLLQETGSRAVFPWMQFAINPCDVLQFTKVELQGIVMPEGPPHLLDGSTFLPKDSGLFTTLGSSGGTTGPVANVAVSRG